MFSGLGETYISYARSSLHEDFHGRANDYIQNAIIVLARYLHVLWFGLVWFGLVWFGLVWFGLVWFGLVWLLSPGQTRKHCCGNICDSRCFLKCFPVCPRVETLLPEKQKCFLANSEIFDVSLCFSLMFPSVCPL